MDSPPLPRILVIDDEKNLRLSLSVVLEAEGYSPVAVESAEEGLEHLAREEFFMVITDARLGGMSGYEFLAQARTKWVDLPVVMITAYATPKLAVEAIKLGAIDYLAKPFAPEELLHAVARCAERFRLLRENEWLRTRSKLSDVSQIIGTSPAITRLRDDIKSIAASSARVLILGESGTGKELIARAVHSLSERSHRKLIPINCAAFIDNLAEDELFGHEKGAFTGATKLKPGKVELADRGTLFLDEIGELSLVVQSKLFRFLEDGTFYRVGGTQELRSDVRLIAATNRDLEQAVVQNKFRPELYHRLNVIQITPPPLRDRREDIPLLAAHLLAQACRRSHRSILPISPEAQARLQAYDYPGNVRELEHIMDRAVVMCKNPSIQPDDLQFRKQWVADMRTNSAASSPQETEVRLASLDLNQAHAKLTEAAMLRSNQNISQAAQLLGISRFKFYRMLKKAIGSHEQSIPPTLPGTRDN
ncbi:MAG: response regulator [Verrucomicrobia bacterium]|nr:MAG: response regulator [Verrucomicrobiota bacterium]